MTIINCLREFWRTGIPLDMKYTSSLISVVLRPFSASHLTWCFWNYGPLGSFYCYPLFTLHIECREGPWQRNYRLRFLPPHCHLLCDIKGVIYLLVHSVPTLLRLNWQDPGVSKSRISNGHFEILKVWLGSPWLFL